jgi:tRNA U34 5-methylaminomethyl-2-thiouridine-forming methyltransferase MnmC
MGAPQDYHAKLAHVDELIETALARIIRNSNKLQDLRKHRKRIVKILEHEAAQAAQVKEQAKAVRRQRQVQVATGAVVEQVPAVKLDPPPLTGIHPVVAQAETRAQKAARMEAAGFRRVTGKR